MAEEGSTTDLVEGAEASAASAPSGPFAVIRQCAAEFVATILFVFIGTASVAAGNNLLIAIAHGLTITLLVAAFGDISGGHINPAVTLGVWIAGGVSLLTGVLYIVCQLAGGIVGALLTKAVLSYNTVTSSGNITTVFESIHGGSHMLAAGVEPIQAIIFEVILTTILVLTVLLVAVEKSSNRHTAPVAIGFAVLVGIAVACNVTGGSMNPARSFGPAIVTFSVDRSVLQYHYVYWIGPIIGSLVASLLHRVIFAGPDKRLIGRE